MMRGETGACIRFANRNAVAKLNVDGDHLPARLKAFCETVFPDTFADALFVASEEIENLAASIVSRQTQGELAGSTERRIFRRCQAGAGRKLFVE